MIIVSQVGEEGKAAATQPASKLQQPPVE